MTGEYLASHVCISCRRQLRVRLSHRINNLKSSRNASSHSVPFPYRLSATPTKSTREQIPEAWATEQRHLRLIRPHEPLGSVEGDFLKRILADHHPNGGPYSNPHQRRTEPVGEGQKPKASTYRSKASYWDSLIGHTTIAGYQKEAKIPSNRSTSHTQPPPQSLQSSPLSPPTAGVAIKDSFVPNVAFRTQGNVADTRAGVSSSNIHELPSSRLRDEPLKANDSQETNGDLRSHTISRAPESAASISLSTRSSSPKLTGSSELSRALSGTSSKFRLVEDLDSVVDPHTEVARTTARKDISRNIDAIRSEEATLIASWEAFQEVVRFGGLQELKRDAKIRNTLAHKFARRWSVEGLGQVQFTPSSVFRQLDILGLNYGPHHWTTALMQVHSSIARHLTRSPRVEHLPSLPTLCQEVVSLWDYFLSLYGCCGPEDTSTSSLESSPITWDSMIKSKEMLEVRTWFSKNFKRRLFHFFVTTSQSYPTLDFSALATFALLHRALQEPSLQARTTAFEPFAMFLSQLLTHSDAQRNYCEHDRWTQIMKDASAGQIDVIVDSLQSLLSTTVVPSISSHAATSEDKANDSSPTQATTLEELYRKRVGRAIAKGDAMLLERLVDEARPSTSLSKEDIWTSELCVQFLLGFMKLRRPQRAVDLWNEMLQRGVKPTLQMWDIMLRGFGSMRDAAGVDQVWCMLLDSGLEPDAHLWASRIQALTSGGWWRQGMLALEDMVAQWLRAARARHPAMSRSALAILGDCPGVPKPTVEVMNGLIPGLARARRQQELTKVFLLMKAIGVKPSVYSFNPMLRQALKEKDHALADEIFDQMQEQGIHPDVATFTLLMHSLFLPIEDGKHVYRGESAPSDLTARQEAASDLLETMERHGIQANVWTFSTLIDGLLKSDNRSSTSNLEAAESVLSFMRKRKIELNSQIYTSFMMYHFRQQSPDFTVIDGLWNLARTNSATVLDTVFFDRLIEGFARCSQINRMKVALDQADQQACTPGWVALTEAVKALAAVGDWTGAEGIVKKARSDLQCKTAFRARMGKAWFIETLKELGIDSRGIADLSITEDDAIQA